jgi:hypothetical protein
LFRLTWFRRTSFPQFRSSNQRSANQAPPSRRSLIASHPADQLPSSGSGAMGPQEKAEQ